MIFEELNLSKPLFSAIEELAYVYATPIQVRAFAPILAGKDILGIAQTGTGKTFAYLLPILRDLKYSEQRAPRILIVVPTRELVTQVVREIEKIAKFIRIRYAGVYGGTNINTQKQLVYNGLDILVATPGRLYDLYLTGVLRFNNIQKIVIDEVDELLNQGFRIQLVNILEVLPPKRQNLMFSATLTKDVEEFINQYFVEFEKIEIAPHGTPIEKIDQSLFFVPNFFTKINLLTHLIINNLSELKVLIFVETKKLADLVYEKLLDKIDLLHKEKIGVIHSNKAQNQRFNTLKKFAEGEYKILISTDIIARGIDVQDVTHVINFDMPINSADYIHRIGRTGRIDKPGIAISFVNEAEREYLKQIEIMMKKSIPQNEMPEEIEISNVFTEEERPKLYDKAYLKAPKKTKNPAFHQKKDKNKKTNSGSPAKKRKKF